MKERKAKSKREEKVWQSIERVWAKTKSVPVTKIKAAVEKAVAEVRRA